MLKIISIIEGIILIALPNYLFSISDDPLILFGFQVNKWLITLITASIFLLLVLGINEWLLDEIISRRKKINNAINKIFEEDKILTLKEICYKWSRMAHPDSKFCWDDIFETLIKALWLDQISSSIETKIGKIEVNNSYLYGIFPESFEKNLILALYVKIFQIDKRYWIYQLPISRLRNGLKNIR